MGNRISTFAWNVGATTGSVIGSIAAIIVYPAKYLTDRLAHGFKLVREGMRSLTAFVYAKGKQNLYSAEERDCCLPDNTVHSQKFRDKYDNYQNKSTTEILFGKMRAAQAERQGLLVNDDDSLKDPITHDTLVDPVIDPHGHTFSRSSITAWLNRRQTCPLSQEPLDANQLIPNRTLDEALKKGLKI